jgi:ribosomal-protein-alanine N-acetyltransferase
MVLNGGGKGYATEAFKRVIKFLFEEVEVETIYAEHLEANPASGRVMEKCGLTYEGTLRGRILDKISKKNEDIKSYSITREEYFK